MVETEKGADATKNCDKGCSDKKGTLRGCVTQSATACCDKDQQGYVA